LQPTLVRLAVAIGAVVAAGAVTIFVFTRSTAKPSARPDSETPAETMIEPPPHEPAVQSPGVTPARTAPPPVPAARAEGGPSPGEITEMLVTARRVENTDPKRSRELLFLTLVADPQNVEALERLSKKLVTDENPRSARDLVDRCLSAEPRNPECAALKAKIAGEPPAATTVAEAQQCLAQNPDAVDCMYTLADNALYEGKKDNAGLLALGMHRAAPESAVTKLTVGRVRAASGEYAQALQLFAAACELGNKDACFRADLLRKEGW
jgi:hypothetical protein